MLIVRSEIVRFAGRFSFSICFLLVVPLPSLSRPVGIKGPPPGDLCLRLWLDGDTLPRGAGGDEGYVLLLVHVLVHFHALTSDQLRCSSTTPKLRFGIVLTVISSIHGHGYVLH